MKQGLSAQSLLSTRERAVICYNNRGFWINRCVGPIKIYHFKESTVSRISIQRTFKTLIASSLFSLLLSGCGSNSSGGIDSDHGLVPTPTMQTPDPDTNGTTPETNTTNPITTFKSLALSINQTSINKDHNTNLKVMATYQDGTKKDITKDVQWIISPKDAIKITDHTLTALKDTNITLQAKVGNQTSNPVTLSVYWEVNGHRLPPEPDPKVNNATLLGVDVNHNGVRDDVERKVYAAYPKAIQRAVMMQAFKTEQAMLADPDLVKYAREWAEKEDKALNCRRFLNLYKNQNIKRISRVIDDWQYNAENRIKKYFKFDQALSGGVYSLREPNLQDCEFDVEKVLELDR